MIKNLGIEDQGKTVRGRFWEGGVGDGKNQHRNSICTSAVSHLCYCVLTQLCVLDLSAFFRRVHEGRNSTVLAFQLFKNLILCPSQKCCTCRNTAWMCFLECWMVLAVQPFYFYDVQPFHRLRYG